MVRRILRLLLTFPVIAAVFCSYVFAGTTVTDLYQEEQAAESQQTDEPASSGRNAVITDIWLDIQNGVSYEDLINTYGSDYQYRYFINSWFMNEHNHPDSDDSEPEFSDTYGQETTTVFVETDALDEEDIPYVTCQAGNIYILTLPSTDQAAVVLEKYEAGRASEASFDTELELFHSGEEGYEYLSWVPDHIHSDVIADEIVKTARNGQSLPAITIGLIDSGVNYRHELLQGRVKIAMYDFYDNDQDANDEEGHGTHVAGIIADMTLPNVKINAYKITDAKGKSSAKRLVQALDQAIKDNVQIINLSLGAPMSFNEDKTEPSTAVKAVYAMLDKAAQKGILVVMAAGNNGEHTDSTYPTNYRKYASGNTDNILVVSALSQDGTTIESLSNYGDVDICTIGSNLYSAYIPGNAYRYMSGTSMAAPVITGAIALLMTYFRDWSAYDAKQYLLESAADLGAPGYDIYYGYGKADVSIMAPVPVITPAYTESGSPVTVSIETGSEANIYYTIDGSEPQEKETESTKRYTKPFTIQQSCVVKAKAVKEHKVSSTTIQHKYYIGDTPMPQEYEVSEQGYITRYTGSQKSIKVPESINGIAVKGISDEAFADDHNIVSVTIPQTVTEVGRRAFDSDMVTVYLEGKLDHTGEYPFGPIAIVYQNQDSGNEELLSPYGYEIYYNGHTNHEYEVVIVEDPSCTHTGTQQKVCKICGQVKEETEIGKLNHEMEYFPEVQATCTEPGESEHWHCLQCGRWFADMYGEEEIAEGCWVIPQSHTLEFYPRTEPTCEEAGNVPYWECGMCGAVFINKDNGLLEVEREELVVPAAGHVVEIIPAVEATCKTYGATEGEVCSVCGKTLRQQELVALSGHDIEYHSGKDATCTEAGWQPYETCRNCDYTTYTEIPATGHSYDNVQEYSVPVVMQQPETPQQTEEQWQEPDTDVQPDTETEEQPESDTWFDDEEDSNTQADFFTEDIPVTNGTTEEVQYHTWSVSTCSRCGDSIVQDGNCPEGHGLVYTQSIPATCQAEGFYEYSCVSPGCTAYGSSATPIVGHTLVHYNHVPASCTQQGMMEHWYCSTCGRFFICQEGVLSPAEQEQLVIPAHDHRAVYHEAVEATCRNNGSLAYWECADCGSLFIKEGEAFTQVEYEQTIIPKTEHQADTDQGYGGNCLYAGVTEGSYCSRCGAVLEGQQTVPAGAHVFGESALIREAACTDNGLKAGKCSACGKVVSEIIMPEGHNMAVTKEGREATCEQAGLTQEIACSRCGKTANVQKTIPAKGHDYKESESKEATCTEDGYTRFKCESCGKEKTEPVMATGHSWGEWTVTKAAAENVEGIETRTCSNNQSHVETRPIPALAHIHSMEKTEAVPAGCEQDGNNAYWFCSRCGRYFADAECVNEIRRDSIKIPATGHDWGKWELVDEHNAKRVCKNNPEHIETKKVWIPVQEVKVSESEIHIRTGAEHTLQAAVFPDMATDKTVVWESLDPEVAVVSEDGVVKGVSEGNTQVRAVAKDTTNGEVSAQCAVYITDLERGVYKVTRADGLYIKGSMTPLTLSISGDFSKFQEIRIDNNDLPPEAYTVSQSGDIVIAPESLELLDTGYHILRVAFTDGSASVRFVVAMQRAGGQANGPDTQAEGTGKMDSAQTDDTHHAWVWLLMAAAGIAVLCGGVYIKQKIKKRRECL